MLQPKRTKFRKMHKGYRLQNTVNSKIHSLFLDLFLGQIYNIVQRLVILAFSGILK